MKRIFKNIQYFQQFSWWFFRDNYVKYWTIIVNLSLLLSEKICIQIHWNTSHEANTVLPSYLAKLDVFEITEVQ